MYNKTTFGKSNSNVNISNKINEKDIDSEIKNNKEIKKIIVKTGLEVLKEGNFKILENKKILLLTNHTGVDNNMISTIDILYKAKNVSLVGLLAPEHGIRGNIYAGINVDNQIDKKTNLPVYSLYQNGNIDDIFNNIDAIVYDIQDIGCRSYTYISSMGYAMELASKYDKEFIVLDRPNPLGGNKVEGCLPNGVYHQYVCRYKIPYIYGLTCGELAMLLNNENMLIDRVKCKLHVVKMEGWHRNMLYKDTNLTFVMTSPHIPDQFTAIFYPITGFLGNWKKINHGVGYTTPFKLFCSDFINTEDLLDELNKQHIEGFVFRPIYIKPFYGNYKDKNIQGVQIYINDYQKAELTHLHFKLIETIKKLYPDINVLPTDDKDLEMLSNIYGDKKVIDLFTKNYKWSDVKEYWNKDVKYFKDISKKYYLYD